MKTLVQYILEKQGIFNGCEDIANELTLLFIKKMKWMKKKGKLYTWSFEFDASAYNPIFRNKIMVKGILEDRKELDAESNFGKDEKESKKLAEDLLKGKLLYTDKEIENFKKKVLYITIRVPISNVSVYDIKGVFMHELTHLYAAIIFYDRGEDYFGRKYFEQEDQENDSEYLLYIIQQDEINSILPEFKPELDKIKRNGFDDVFNKLKDKKEFKQIIKFKNDFNKQNFLADFDKLKLHDYPELFRNHFECDYSDTKIYRITGEKLNDAYNQLYTNIIKMIYEYKGSDDFIEKNFLPEIIDPYEYMPEFRQMRRK